MSQVPLLPPAHPSIASTSRLIARQASKQSRSLRNRLHSIAEDALFVTDTAAELGLPLVANERCGRWYVAPDASASTPDGVVAGAYFKSTDGHYGTWSFSLRRLNLAVLEVVGDAGGCIIVDSTRRGKHMPDALSKTVPIWCAVMNRLLLPDLEFSHKVITPIQVISPSEHEQIANCLDGFVEQAKQNLELNIPELRARVRKPMYPMWLARSLDLTVSEMSAPLEVQDGRFNPVYLCMASVFQYETAISSVKHFDYVQGAGDDAESWALGLTPNIFWQHKGMLLNANEDELPEIITALLDQSEKNPTKDSGASLLNGSIMLSDLDHCAEHISSNSLAILCSSEPPEWLDEISLSRVLHLRCGVGKIGSRDLRRELPKVPGFISDQEFDKILICCANGKDLSVGVALTVLIQFSDDKGLISSKRNEENWIDKMLIRKRLSWITSSIPSASPSRATLNAVNSFLMDSPR